MSELDPSDGKNVSQPPQPSSPLEGGGGTSEKKHHSGYRSGYQRSKARLHKLNADLEALQEQHQQLLLDHEELLAAFNEITRLNGELALELREARRRPTVPSFTNLMGHR
jgi:hypothetical protein